MHGKFWLNMTAPANAESPTSINQEHIQGRRLSERACQLFAREGYVAPLGPVLPPETFAGLCATFEDLLARRPQGVRPEELDVPHLTEPRLFDYLFHPHVLDLVEPLLGPDLALFSSHFICKPGHDGKRVPWHQDSFYWRHLLSPMQVVTVWLAIDASDESNGAMRVIPRTHLEGDAAYEDVDLRINTFPKEISRARLDQALPHAVTLTLQPNQCSLHDAGLFHGSEANTSDRRRCGYTMRFISAATKFDAEAGHYHQIYLARGRDRAGNAYGNPLRPRPDLVLARAGRIRKGH